MEEPVGGQHLPASRRKRASIHVGHHPPGLSDNQRAAGDIPGLQVALPESVHAPGGDVAEIDGGRPESSDRARPADERTEESFTVPTNEMERFFYSFSTLHCLAVSMQNGGAGTGTVIRPDTMRRYATEAGFTTVETLDVEHPQFVLYRLA